MDSGAGVRWLIAIGLIVAATACGPNAAPITLDAQATPTPVPWKLEPTPTAGPPTLTAAPVAPAATPTGSPRFAPTVVLPPFGATATPAPLGARPIAAAQPPIPVPVPTVGPASPPIAPPAPLTPVECLFADRTASVPQYSTPLPATGLAAYAVGEPVPGLYLELRLPRTTFVAGALIQPEVAVRNTIPGDTAVSVSVVAMPQSAPADPRSFPTVFSGPGLYRPPLTVPPRSDADVHVTRAGAIRHKRTYSDARYGARGCRHANDGCAVQTDRRWPRATAEDRAARRPTAVVREGDRRRRSCADRSAPRRDDSSGHEHVMQSGTSSSAAGAVWAGRFPSNLPTQGELAISVFVGGENYETSKAEMTVSL